MTRSAIQAAELRARGEFVGEQRADSACQAVIEPVLLMKGVSQEAVLLIKSGG